MQTNTIKPPSIFLPFAYTKKFMLSRKDLNAFTQYLGEKILDLIKIQGNYQIDRFKFFDPVLEIDGTYDYGFNDFPDIILEFKRNDHIYQEFRDCRSEIDEIIKKEFEELISYFENEGIKASLCIDDQVSHMVNKVKIQLNVHSMTSGMAVEFQLF